MNNLLPYMFYFKLYFTNVTVKQFDYVVPIIKFNREKRKRKGQSRSKIVLVRFS